MDKRYGGYTIAELKELIQHSEDSEEGIDYMTGDEATGCNIIRDLLAELESK